MSGIVKLADGRNASFEIVGRGIPALILPGGPGFCATYMRSDAELLSDELCCYLVDPHGSGFSTSPPDPADYSPEGHARFYEEVRKALNLPKVVVLGHSFGATAALTYAAIFPESIECCVAIAALGIGPEADARSGRKAESESEALLLRHAGSPWYEAARPVMDHWTELILAATAQEEIDDLIATILPFFLAQPDRPETARSIADMVSVLRTNIAAIKAWEGGMFQSADLRPLLGRVSCPTLIVAGELDYLCGPAQANLIAAGITGSRLAILANSGHMPSIETPGRYRQAVIDFLRRIGTAPRSPAGTC